MAVIPLTQPYSMKNALLTVEADDFTAAVSQAQFDPTTQTTTWRGIGGNTLTDQTPATWALALGLAQDLDPDGLLRWLLDHEGETADIVLSPIGIAGPSVAATVVVAPGTIGASADGNTAVATVSMGVQGRPVFDDIP